MLFARLGARAARAPRQTFSNIPHRFRHVLAHHLPTPHQHFTYLFRLGANDPILHIAHRLRRARQRRVQRLALAPARAAAAATTLKPPQRALQRAKRRRKYARRVHLHVARDEHVPNRIARAHDAR